MGMHWPLKMHPVDIFTAGQLLVNTGLTVLLSGITKSRRYILTITRNNSGQLPILNIKHS